MDVVRGKRLIVGHELDLVAAEVLLLDMPLVGQRVSLLEVLQPDVRELPHLAGVADAGAHAALGHLHRVSLLVDRVSYVRVYQTLLLAFFIRSGRFEADQHLP